MKKILIAMAMAAMSASASAQLAYPGSTWSELTFNPSPIKGTPEDDNVILQGAIQQGIDWKKYGNYTLNTYVGANYSIDKNGLAYNNKFSPMIGVRLIRSFQGSGVAEAGVRVVHQRSFRGVTQGPTSGTGIQVYASYWFGWNLKK